MKRDLTAYLLSWKDSQNRKPVLLRGARQVGKSYLAKELGRQFPDYLEINPLISKVTFLDIALAQAILGIDGGQCILDPDQAFVNLGSITEAFVGQEILAYSLADRKTSLYYWLREKSGRAEIDYVTGINGHVIPIEVKSGVTGSLKSLRQFLEKKKGTPYGIQVSQRNFFVDKARRVRGYPLYAISSVLKGPGGG